MDVTLKFKVNDQDIELKTNLTNSAGRIYRQQFNRDLLRDMAEIYKKMNKSPFDGVDMTGIDFSGKTEQELYQELMNRVDLSKLVEARSELNALDFEETERGEQITWAFAKNADKNLPNYTEWSDSLDYILPVGDIVSALYEVWGKSAQPTIELKN